MAGHRVLTIPGAKHASVLQAQPTQRTSKTPVHAKDGLLPHLQLHQQGYDQQTRRSPRDTTPIQPNST